MRLNLTQVFFFILTSSLWAQVQVEVNPPEKIKTVIFGGPTEDQFPVVELGETIKLEFDDITASESDYYYKIVHCDYDWQPSQLLKSQYLNGVDNQRITDYENSYSTLQSYSNYKLTIPNENVRLKVSGNFMLEIYNDRYELQFSRRFVVYKDIVTVGGTIKRSRDFNFINEKQVVQLSINAGNFQLVNPKKEVKIAILQNYQWETALYNIAPQYTIGTELVYKYDQETSFYGGNEFLNFDTSDLRAPTSQISRIEVNELYNHYLFSNTYRADRPYSYFPDINGDFVIRTLQGEDNSREAEYTKVHFSLPYDELLGLDEVYVFGKFNNYALSEENKMTYNENNGMMEAEIKLKQGFYNYKYVIKREDGTIEINTIDGNFHFTENSYLILVYYRNFGDLYDSIIGVGSANSRNISN
ncbi:type IX secretion system plug protein domain-containing protein [Zobellia alginiliquefaciens]|uniref:type IX secretion system plug protein n=1 Tax=Zobellia alginiliquefaciens TaxID=3032586 RepID=UPI0023E46193|nr:type IX secretion system plug protein domain-containing protein [Zobellia alginiliquefaciens]